MHLLATILLVMFESDIGCKVVCFLAVGTGVEGTLTLVLVAVERYKKICKPPGNQLTSTTKRTVIGSYTVFAVLMGSPFLYYSGVTTVDREVKNVTGQICSMISGPMTNDAIVVGVTLMLTALVELLIMAVLYFRICRKLFLHRKFSVTTKIEIDSHTANTGENVNEHVAGMRISSIITDSTNVKYKTPTRKQQDLFRTGRIASCLRLTMINIVITIVFAVTILPTVILIIIESASTGFSASSHDNELLIVFLSTFYIVNNIANASIYTFMDVKFQKELKAMLYRSSK